MKKLAPIVFYLCLPGIVLVSILPLQVHYWFANILYWIGYKALGYRKQVVRDNLLIAFPNQNAAERTIIEKQFYHFFFDLFAEGIKSFTMTKRQILNRVRIDPTLLQLINTYYEKGQNIFVAMPHYGNWEYGNLGAQLYFKHQVNCIYKELSDPFFDYFLHKLRTRWGSGMFPMQHAFRRIVSCKEINATGFIADQSSIRNNALWLPFFGKEVPFFVGIETMAKKLNTPVIYIYFDRDDQKKYLIKGELITDTPKLVPDGYIIKSFAEKLELQIKAKPELWLWTHRRWKRTRTN